MLGFVAGRDLLQDARLPHPDSPQVDSAAEERGQQRAGEEIPALGRQLRVVRDQV